MGIRVTLDTIIYAVWGKTRLLCRLTIGFPVYSQVCCGIIIIISECSAQMGSVQAGDYSSPSRNNASSTIEGKGDTMTTIIIIVRAIEISPAAINSK